MASNQLARTNDDIQRVLANLLTQVKDPRVQQGMISVTRVETTGDLRYSKVWLSVLGMENEIGSLREGKKADVILIDLNQPSLAPVITYPFRNLVANLVYSARGSEVRTSIIDGNIVMENGVVTTVDEAAIVREANEAARELAQRGAKRVEPDSEMLAMYHAGNL
jgi:N-acyl-D-aspartate/D-glutamate deacylase